MGLLYFALLQVIQANTDPKQPTVVTFPGIPLGKKFKIFPLSWNIAPGVQIELFGCPEQGQSYFIL